MIEREIGPATAGGDRGRGREKLQPEASCETEIVIWEDKLWARRHSGEPGRGAGLLQAEKVRKKGRRGLKKGAEEGSGTSVRDGPLQGPRRVLGSKRKEGRRRRKA